MIETFVKAWDDVKGAVEAQFAAAHPESYKAVVTAVVYHLRDTLHDYERMDPDRIVEIDHGDYHGTLLYVIAADGYQPSTYWAVTVGYGSCSGCDTLQAIRGYEDAPPTAEQVKDYMTLAFDVVRGLRRIASYRLEES